MAAFHTSYAAGVALKTDNRVAKWPARAMNGLFVSSMSSNTRFKEQELQLTRVPEASSAQ